MFKIHNILNIPLIYQIWQAPFHQQKVAELKKELLNVQQQLTVLDLGCGPGTNINLFEKHIYTGVDINPSYINKIKGSQNRRLICNDVNNFLSSDNSTYDLILINSLMHHLDDQQVKQLLHLTSQRLKNSGSIFIFDLILTEEKSIPRTLALLDRGKFPRKQNEWENLFVKNFECLETNTYYLTLMNIKLWHMIYFKGKRLAN